MSPILSILARAIPFIIATFPKVAETIRGQLVPVTQRIGRTLGEINKSLTANIGDIVRGGGTTRTGTAPVRAETTGTFVSPSVITREQVSQPRQESKTSTKVSPDVILATTRVSTPEKPAVATPVSPRVEVKVPETTILPGEITQTLTARTEREITEPARVIPPSPTGVIRGVGGVPTPPVSGESIPTPPSPVRPEAILREPLSQIIEKLVVPEEQRRLVELPLPEAIEERARMRRDWVDELILRLLGGE